MSDKYTTSTPSKNPKGQLTTHQNTLGIIGGMSWESTEVYYRLLNQGVKAKLGGLHSADILMHSLDFAPIAALQAEGDWATLAQLLADSGLRLKKAGAKGLMVATNTMHKVADAVTNATDLPLIHIADSVAQAVLQAQVGTVALLGTQFTMTQDFYKRRLIDQRLTVLIPNAKQQQSVHRIIYKELCQGIIKDTSRQQYMQIIAQLTQRGAQGVILGCTEIGLLITAKDSPIPIFDSTAIHAAAGVDFLLKF